MTGSLARGGLHPDTTTLRVWLAAVWSVVVDLMATGVKVKDLEKLWRQAFQHADTDTAGAPDRETWGLLPEHVAGQERLQHGMQAADAPSAER